MFRIFAKSLSTPIISSAAWLFKVSVTVTFPVPRNGSGSDFPNLQVIFQICKIYVLLKFIIMSKGHEIIFKT